MLKRGRKTEEEKCKYAKMLTVGVSRWRVFKCFLYFSFNFSRGLIFFKIKIFGKGDCQFLRPSLWRFWFSRPGVRSGICIFLRKARWFGFTIPRGPPRATCAAGCHSDPQSRPGVTISSHILFPLPGLLSPLSLRNLYLSFRSQPKFHFFKEGFLQAPQSTPVVLAVMVPRTTIVILRIVVTIGLMSASPIRHWYGLNCVLPIPQFICCLGMWLHLGMGL